jgi:glutamate/tyrosine decarboxylase-like PLP-dependent enzyme
VPGATIGTLSALHAARHTAAARAETAGRARPARWAIVTSAEAHTSVGLAARVMDVDVVVAPVDAAHRLTGDAVAAVLDAEGARVVAVVAAAGTTNLGVIDDLPGIAAACDARAIWLHVDGAYGGAIVASPRARPLLAGLERASSLVVDPHKWLFAPYDCCALLYREPALAASALSPRAEYIDPAHGASAWNPFSYGLHLSRRPRGVPLWFSLAVYGTDAYARAIDDTLALARAAAADIRARPYLALLVEPTLSVLAFQRRGWTAADYARWSAWLLDERRGWVAPSAVDGAPALRLCLVNPRVTLDRLRAILDTLAD